MFVRTDNNVSDWTMGCSSCSYYYGFGSRYASLSLSSLAQTHTQHATTTHAGTGYAISLFTDLFKDHLDLDQSQVDWISTCGNAGLYSAILGGLFYNRVGPKWTALIGAILIGVGFGGMHECGKEDATCSENGVGFLNFIAQHGSGWIASCTMATSVRNFPSQDRGVVVGIAKGAFAISTGFIAQIYIGMYKPNALKFLKFLAIFAPCVIVICIPFLRLISADEKRSSEKSSSSSSCGLIVTSVLILFNGAWLLFVAMLQQMSESKNIKLFSLYTCVSFFSMILCVVPCVRCFRSKNRQGQRAIELTKNSILKVIRRRTSQKYERVSLASQVEDEEQKEGETDDDLEMTVRKVKHKIRSLSRSSVESAKTSSIVVDDKSLCQVLVSQDFYILAVAFLVGSGSGLMFINNVTQIAQSKTYALADTEYLRIKNTLIVLFGASNLYGRVVIGAVSDRLGGKQNRALLLAVCIACMGISHFIMSMMEESDIDSLYPCTLLVGLFFGCVFSLCASLVADLFGTKYFAGNYGAADIAPSLGSLLFSTLLAGKVYDTYALPDGESGNSTCYGSDCFKLSFVVMGLMCLFGGVPFSLYLQERIKNAATRTNTT